MSNLYSHELADEPAGHCLVDEGGLGGVGVVVHTRQPICFSLNIMLSVSWRNK